MEVGRGREDTEAFMPIRNKQGINEKVELEWFIFLEIPLTHPYNQDNIILKCSLKYMD